MNEDDIRRAIHDALGEGSHPASLVDRIRARARMSGGRRVQGANWLVAGTVAAALALIIGGTTIAVRGHRASPQPPAIAGASATASPVPTGTPSATADVSASASTTANPAATPQPAPTSRPTASPHPSPSTAGSPTAAVPDCSASDLSVTVATDASSYAPATPIRMTTSLRNVSPHACSAPSGGCGPQVYVQDSNGNFVWSSRAPGTAACPVPAKTTMAAGQSSSFEATWQQCTWQAGGCSGQVPPGTYMVRGEWPAGTSPAATFRIS